jgi:hypothetical protein
MQGLDTKENFEFGFSDQIKNNYLKIISNIFYINITKAATKFKLEIIDQNKFEGENNEQINEKIFNDMYKSSLKETRNEVAEFFKVTPHEIYSIPIKVLFRVYPYYLDEKDEVRIKYKAMNDEVNKVTSYIEKRKVIDRFTNPSNPDYSLKPVDYQHDFKKINQEISGFDDEDRNDINKMMTDIREIYNNKENETNND